MAGLFVLYTNAPASALTTFYSDFGPSDTYYQSGGYSVAGASAPTTYSAWGVQFTASSSGALTQIDLALTSNERAVTGNFEPSGANVYLYNDVSGTPGSSQIGSWTVSASGQFGSTNDTVVTIGTINGINLTSGAAYWLVIVPSDSSGTTFDVWNLNSLSPLATGNMAAYSDPTQIPSGGSVITRDLPAFDLLGNAAATPLPATLPLFATGLGGLGLLGWRKKRKAAALAA